MDQTGAWNARPSDTRHAPPGAVARWLRASRHRFLRPAINHPCIDVGAFSYASAHHPPEDWAAHLAPYFYEVSPEKLVIGKFCQIADGVVFITASANHRRDGFSTFPFAVFGGAREGRPSMPGPGPDT